MTFNHGLQYAGASNQLHLYVDNLEDTRGQVANTDNAVSYTDGLQIATFEVFPRPDELGQLSPAGGTDEITFKLIDDVTGGFGKAFGLSDHKVLLLTVQSEITSVDLQGDGTFEYFKFGAFDCGGSPLDSCSRERGTAEMQIAQMPLPGSLGIAMVGFAVMGWMGQRKNLKSERF